jgi:hypothetical protein
MKIKLDNSIKNITPSSDVQPNSADKVKKNEGKGFEKFLEEAKAAKQGIETGEIKQYTEVIQHLLKGNEATGLQVMRKNAIISVERLFATLEMYRNALNNDRIDLSSMNAILEDMNKEND